ncbi:hypothetical protein MAM1_0354c09974 [Mucor ambiguus]|uniref:Uncharacterized protein n=1 Tax=Mucor ambiguus TaxID=91626 RepID=A0A0C9N729_9FUNG|nr:hypothetical protein MAM1_0354c09974 [Mucor ambiguus]
MFLPEQSNSSGTDCGCTFIGIYVHRYGKHLSMLGHGNSDSHHSCRIARLFLASTCSRHDPDVIFSLSLSLSGPSGIAHYDIALDAVGVGYGQHLIFHDGDALYDHVDLRHENDCDDTLLACELHCLSCFGFG